MKELLAATKSHLVQAGDEAAAKVQLSRDEIDKVAGGKKGHAMWLLPSSKATQGDTKPRFADWIQSHKYVHLWQKSP